MKKKDEGQIAMKFLLNKNLLPLASFSILFLFTYFQYTMNVHDYLVPDEKLFLNVVEPDTPGAIQITSILEYLTIPNELGYGSIFWQFLVLLIHVFKADVITVKTIFTILYIAPPWLLFLTPPGSQGNFNPLSKFYAILLFMLMPAAWFTGKIIGPEIPGFFFISLGLLVLLRTDRWLLALSFLSLAVGMKISNAPVIVLYGVYVLLEMIKRNWSINRMAFKAVWSGLLFLLVFSLGNIYLFVNWNGYISNIPSASQTTIDLSRIWSFLFTDLKTWDGVKTTGFFLFVLTWPAFILFFIQGFIGKENRNPYLAVFSGWAFQLLLLFFSPVYYGWYWFSLVFAFPLAIADERGQYSIRKHLVMLSLLVFTAGNGFRIVESVSERMNVLELVRNKKSINMCVFSYFINKPFQYFIDFSEHGLMNPMYGFVNQAHHLWPSYLLMQGNSDLLQKYKLPTLDSMKGSGSILVVGERLKSYNEEILLNFDRELSEHGMKRSFQGTCKGVEVYFVK